MALNTNGTTPAPAGKQAISCTTMHSDYTTLAGFQALIHDRYFKTDSARGPAGTWLWFTEEVGELAEAIARRERGEANDANLQEEFADVLAWLATLANITGVDLTKAVHAKYIADGGPDGTK
jgi:NTP pyrophosphatase (non-canonical NTP hydrolase)